jgi:hypothetical protein
MKVRDWTFKAMLGSALACSLNAAPSAAQDGPPPTLRVGSSSETVRIDGVLDEPEWAAADSIDGLTETDPTEGAAPTGRTVVRVLAGARAIVVGILRSDEQSHRRRARMAARHASAF